jgi:hypothetical protein
MDHAKLETIVKIKFGSHLYGTATPTSDLDIKGIYIPSARDILLQRITPIVSFNRSKERGEKNTAEDVDYELYSPAKFLSLVAEGQAMALEILFAPKSSMLSEPHPLWQEIQTLAPKLFTRQAACFLRYCKQQANKYGIKGSRVAAARIALEYLIKAEEENGPGAKLLLVQDSLKKLADKNEFLALGECVDSNGTNISYFEICGKKAPFNTSIKSARSMAQRLMDEYGERSLAAERNKGIDWKALSHAVRVGHQAVEFLTRQHITLPRPEAAHLLDIKLGKLKFQEVGEEIEQLLIQVEDAALNSSLPENFDHSLIDNFIKKLHLTQIQMGAK